MENFDKETELLKLYETKKDYILDDYIFKAFAYWFRNIKGYEDWTDDEIDLSMNRGDINEFVEYIKTNFK